MKSKRAVLRPIRTANILKALRAQACARLGANDLSSCNHWRGDGTEVPSACDTCPRPLCTGDALAAALFPTVGGKPELRMGAREGAASRSRTDIHALMGGVETLELPAVKAVLVNAHRAGLIDPAALNGLLEDVAQYQKVHNLIRDCKRTFERYWIGDKLGHDAALCWTWLDADSPPTWAICSASLDSLETLSKEAFGPVWHTALHPRRPASECGQSSYFMNWGNGIVQYNVALNCFPCPLDGTAASGEAQRRAVRLVLRPFERFKHPSSSRRLRHKNATTDSESGLTLANLGGA